nr:Ig-like domain-containing protein [Aquabacterium terrae]
MNAAAPGQTVTLMAAASDDFGVDRVQFFRIESDGNAVSLGSDSSAPYQQQTAMPNTSANTVRYFARAFDEGDQFNDSDQVTVTVLR